MKVELLDTARRVRAGLSELSAAQWPCSLITSSRCVATDRSAARVLRVLYLQFWVHGLPDVEDHLDLQDALSAQVEEPLAL